MDFIIEKNYEQGNMWLMLQLERVKTTSMEYGNINIYKGLFQRKDFLEILIKKYINFNQNKKSHENMQNM